MVEVTFFARDDGAHLLHLVNASGHRGVSCVEPVTMHDLEVVVPFEGEPSRVTALVADRELEWSAAEGRLTIEIPTLGLLEAVRIER